MISFLTTIIFLNISIATITMILTIHRFNIVENIEYYTRNETIYMLLFVLLAGITWPIMVLYIFFVEFYTAVIEILLYINTHCFDEKK